MILKIILGILLILLLILLVPVTLSVAYQQQMLSVKLRVLFLRFTLYPTPIEEKPQELKPKKPRKRKSKKSSAQPPKKSLKEKLSDISSLLKLIMELLPTLKTPLRWIFKSIVFYDICVNMRVAKEDAFQTALTYGRLQQAFHTGYAFLCNFFRVKIPSVCIYPDFLAEPSEAFIQASGKVRTTPFVVLVAALCLLVTAGWRFLRWSSRRLKHQSSVKSSS